MTDPDAVARALSRLAVGTVRPIDDPTPERVVDDAETAMEDVDRAAAFFDGGGELRLRRAVQIADASGDDALVARGQAVLSTLEAFRTAANEESPARTASERRTTSTPLAQRSSRGES